MQCCKVHALFPNPDFLWFATYPQHNQTCNPELWQRRGCFVPGARFQTEKYRYSEAPNLQRSYTKAPIQFLPPSKLWSVTHLQDTGHGPRPYAHSSCVDFTVVRERGLISYSHKKLSLLTCKINLGSLQQNPYGVQEASFQLLWRPCMQGKA